MNNLKKSDLNVDIKTNSGKIQNLDKNDTGIAINNLNIKPEFCSVDEYKFNSNYNTSEDELIMPGENGDSLIIDKKKTKSKRLLVCEFCGRQYQKSAELSRHKRLHTGEKPYKCKYCEKAFSCNANCVVHERVHTGEKRYHCDKCDKKYTNATSLRSHKRRHAGIVSHKCDICNKYFATYMNLMRHKESCIG